MTFTRLNSVKTTTDVVSGILNWICPECGGRMGGQGKEFKCQGECQKDWRLIWERLFAVPRRPYLDPGPGRLQPSG
jgi:tRNA(Ile2) C34 agmatinyltransferase TiaS